MLYIICTPTHTSHTHTHHTHTHIRSTLHWAAESLTSRMTRLASRTVCQTAVEERGPRMDSWWENIWLMWTVTYASCTRYVWGGFGWYMYTLQNFDYLMSYSLICCGIHLYFHLSTCTLNPTQEIDVKPLNRSLTASPSKRVCLLRDFC